MKRTFTPYLVIVDLPLLILMLLIWMLPVKEANAQRQSRDAVYLKDGSVVTGTIVQYDSLKGVRISNDCGIWYYSFDKVESAGPMTKEWRPALKKSGYYNLSSLGLLFGEGANGIQPFTSLTMVNGWQFHQHLFTGIGLGYEFYEWGVLPVFADVKYFFRPDNITPFISFRIGYSYSLTHKIDLASSYIVDANTFGGLLLNPELGLSIPVGVRNAFIVGIGYQYQELSYEEPEYQWYYYQSRRVYTHFNRISLRIGFVFQ